MNNMRTIQCGPGEWVKVQVPYYSVIRVQNGTTDNKVVVNCALGNTPPTYLESGFRVSDNRILDFYLGGDNLYIKASSKTTVTVHFYPISRKNGLSLQMSVFETVRNVDNFIIKVPAAHTFTIQNIGANNINVLGNCQYPTKDGLMIKQYEYQSLDTGQDTFFSVNGANASFTYSIVNAFNSDSICGPIGPQGDIGPQGAAGMSAYELAVENGFEGTVEEWLKIVTGPDSLQRYSSKTADVTIERYSSRKKNTDMYAFVVDNTNLLYPLQNESEFEVRISGSKDISTKTLELYGVISVDGSSSELPIIDGCTGRELLIGDVIDGSILKLRVNVTDTLNGRLNGELLLLNSVDEIELKYGKLVNTEKLTEVVTAVDSRIVNTETILTDKISDDIRLSEIKLVLGEEFNFDEVVIYDENMQYEDGTYVIYEGEYAAVCSDIVILTGIKA